jgi:hypothetical protein
LLELGHVRKQLAAQCRAAARSGALPPHAPSQR